MLMNIIGKGMIRMANDKDNNKNISLDESAIDNDDDDICDLNIFKTCDSCGECLDLDKTDFKIIKIEGLAPEGIEIDEYILQDETLSKDEDIESNDLLKVVYIEDIPKLKEEYDKKLDELLGRK